MKTVRRPPYPKWNPGYFPCSSLTPLPLSSRRPSVSFGGFGLRFAQGLEHLDGPGMFQRFPELFECIDPMDPDASKIAESLTEMLKRHGETVLQVMEEQISLVTSELARESLPKDCLIRLISGSSQTMGQDTGSLEDNSASSETESHEASLCIYKMTRLGERSETTFGTRTTTGRFALVIGGLT